MVTMIEAGVEDKKLRGVDGLEMLVAAGGWVTLNRGGLGPKSDLEGTWSCQMGPQWRLWAAFARRNDVNGAGCTRLVTAEWEWLQRRSGVWDLAHHLAGFRLVVCTAL